MSVPLLAIAAAAGVILILLTFLTRIYQDLRFWPTPKPWGWQSLLFWTLFRTLNLTTFALAALDWQRWQGLPPDRLFGAGVAITGAVPYGLSCYALGRGNVYCGRDGLVTKGIYRWTRNPQYATAIPAYLGLALASYSLGALILAVLLTITFSLMALAEEPWLEAAYGEEYRTYRRQVARFYNWRYALALAKAEFSRLERRLKEARP
jgi:protein-S-isoprenylcysteine O-methyltransferase Ste14